MSSCFLSFLINSKLFFIYPFQYLVGPVNVALAQVKHKKDREDAKAAIADATAQREKEKAAFDAEDAEDKANIAACGKAIKAIEKGMAGGFQPWTETIPNRGSRALLSFLPDCRSS